MAKSSVFKTRLKAVTVLVDRQLYGSEFQTEGELRLKDFADIVRDIRGIVSSSLLEDRNVLVGMYYVVVDEIGQVSWGAGGSRLVCDQ